MPTPLLREATHMINSFLKSVFLQSIFPTVVNAWFSSEKQKTTFKFTAKNKCKTTSGAETLQITKLKIVLNLFLNIVRELCLTSAGGRFQIRTKMLFTVTQSTSCRTVLLSFSESEVAHMGPVHQMCT